MSTSRKTILITGCSRGGIGDSLTRQFHEKGLKVFAASRTLESMEHLSALGIKTMILDVTDVEAIRRVKNEIAELTGGTLDILVNNAGRSQVQASIDYDMQSVRDLFDVNVFAVMSMVKEFAPLLITSGHGLILNMGSAASIAPVPFGSAYNASKAAVQAYTDTLRIELAPFNIRVVYLATGWVKSNISKPYTLPPDSLYAPMDALFQARRVAGAQRGRMDTDIFAKTVVAEALKARPRAWLWAGSSAWLVWLLDTFFPRWIWSFMFSRQYGLRQFEQMVAGRKTKDA